MKRRKTRYTKLYALFSPTRKARGTASKRNSVFRRFLPPRTGTKSRSPLLRDTKTKRKKIQSHHQPKKKRSEYENKLQFISWGGPMSKW